MTDNDPPTALASRALPRHYNAARDLIERNLEAGRAGKTAYIDDAGSYTYAELAERVNRFANIVLALGIHPEQRVLLWMLDSVDFPVAFLGCIQAGIIPVAVNAALPPSDIEFMLNDSRASAAIVSSELIEKFDAAAISARHLRYVVVSGDAFPLRLSLAQLIGAAGTQSIFAATTCDDACFWLYSSGSTGSPKGTVHAHSSLIQSAELYAQNVAGYKENDIVFSASKLPFAYGLGNSLSFPLAVGATAVLMKERPTPAALIERVLKHRPTIFCSIPTAYAAMLAYAALPSRDQVDLRLCISAGEALPEEIGKRWFGHFGCHILDGIGSTEMTHIYLSNRPHDVQYGTTGKPVPGYDVRIVDSADQSVAAGESGELLVRGPTCAMYYWNNRARTRGTFQGEWLRSGDKFRLREDGYYVYEGRMDDMLKVSGLYVSPVEVESALLEHTAVLEAAVVAKTDSEGLIKPYAFVVLKAEQNVSTDELKAHVKSRLAPHKYPRWIEFVPELPRTATGKVQRFKLRDRARH